MVTRAHRGVEVEPLDDVHCMDVVQVNTVVQRTRQHLLAATQHLEVRHGYLGVREIDDARVCDAGHERYIRLIRKCIQMLTRSLGDPTAHPRSQFVGQ